MKLLDLFSGIGGFSLAARWTGRILTAAFCETDPYCCKVLAKNFPGVPIHGDIRNMKGANIGAADIISGGFPCQPFSVAGKRGGAEDDRYLWPEMLRVISDVRPAWVIGENVDGLVRMGVQSRVLKVESRNLERTEDFDRLRRILTREEMLLLFSLLDDLEALGYGAVPIVVPACGVDAPHLRYRVWIVGYCSPAHSAAHYILANSERIYDDRTGHGASAVCGERRESPGLPGCEDVPDADRPGCGELRGAESIGTEHAAAERGRGWLPEPAICRVADGVPARVDRLRSLGNSIVPQVAYEIMMGILRTEATP
jgi:DNA (cytosine-5)-methyltransferase 1